MVADSFQTDGPIPTGRTRGGRLYDAAFTNPFGDRPPNGRSILNGQLNLVSFSLMIAESAEGTYTPCTNLPLHNPQHDLQHR